MPARASAPRERATSLGCIGPAFVHATMGSCPKIPSRLMVFGATCRCESRWRRREASEVLVGGASRSISVVTGTLVTARRGSLPSASVTEFGMSVSAGRSPSAVFGYRVSSTVPSDAIVARPCPHARREADAGLVLSDMRPSVLGMVLSGHHGGGPYRHASQRTGNGRGTASSVCPEGLTGALAERECWCSAAVLPRCSPRAPSPALSSPSVMWL